VIEMLMGSPESWTGTTLSWIRRHARAVLGILVCSMILARPAGAQEPDLSRWTEYGIRLSTMYLMFRVPGGQDREMRPEARVSVVDLYGDLDAFDNTKRPALTLYRHTWSYRHWLWPGRNGLLDMYVIVRTTPEEGGGSRVMDVANLQRMVSADLDRRYETPNRENTRRNRHDLVVRLPGVSEYGHDSIQGRDWLVYAFGTRERESVEYATALTAARYLQVGFEFIDNTRGKKLEWRDRARGVATQIIRSFHLRPAD
jgi:hypothetical protein